MEGGGEGGAGVVSSVCRKGGLQHEGLGWGRGRWMIKSIEEHVQVIFQLWSPPLGSQVS